MTPQSPRVRWQPHSHLAPPDRTGARPGYPVPGNLRSGPLARRQSTAVRERGAAQWGGAEPGSGIPRHGAIRRRKATAPPPSSKCSTQVAWTGSALDLPISLRRATPGEAVVASRWPSHRDVMAHQMAESCHPSGTLGEWWRRRGFSFADCSMPRSARPGSAPPPLSAPRSRTAVDCRRARGPDRRFPGTG